MEMDMTFRLVDMLLPVPPMVDKLIIAMGRILPLIDMDMLLPELPMVDMLLSAMDMPLSTIDSSTMGWDINANI